MVDREIAPAARSGLTRRTCVRVGCDLPVNKPTAKYCSVRCCSSDPARHERLRQQARRVARTPVLPMARQLPLGFTANPEAFIARMCEGREDVPAGMSRLIV